MANNRLAEKENPIIAEATPPSEAGNDIVSANHTPEAEADRITEKERRTDDAEEVKRIMAGLQSGDNTDKGLDKTDRPSLKKTLREALMGIASVEDVRNKPKNLGDREIFTITIDDKEKFLEEENLRKLIPHFGRMVFTTFEDRDEKSTPQLNLPDEESTKEFVNNYFRNGDLGSTDKIYVINEGDVIQGFYFLKKCKLANGENIDHLLLTTMDRPFQGTGAFKKLTKAVFDNEDVSGFTGLSHTPELIKSYLRLAETEKLDIFFCNRKNGDASIPLTEEDKKTLELYKGDIKRQVGEYGLDELQEGVDETYTSYGSESIPPRTMDEVKLSEGSPLRKTFEDMIQYGEKNRPGEALYGSLFVKKR